MLSAFLSIMAKISKKQFESLNRIISNNIYLSNVEEFEEYQKHKLFENPPDMWSEFENHINDYQVRISMKIKKEIEALFNCA